jgi:hypothetical protein
MSPAHPAAIGTRGPTDGILAFRRRGTFSLPEPTLLLAVAVIGIVMIFFRRPDAFLHPQFYAEDGAYFFAPAYNSGGLIELLHQHSGSLAILNRLVSLAAIHLPLGWGPSIFNGVGLLCQLLPALILVSRRSEPLIQSRWIRIGVALFYFALPGSYEVNVNLTNAQWHLALGAALILVARPAGSRVVLAFDALVVALAGLTGPFALLLLPIAIAVAWVRRGPNRYVLATVATLTSVAQLICMLNSPRTTPTSLGASVGSFSRIVGGRVLLGPILGTGKYAAALHHASSGAFWAACVLAGAAFILAVLWKSSAELRLLACFGAICLAVALLRPLAIGANAWSGFLSPYSGSRYFVIPMFTMIVIVGAAIESRSILLRVGSGLYVLAALLIGIPGDWTFPAYPNLHYAHYVSMFDHLRDEQPLRIPENPAPWAFVLVKR